MNATAWFYGTSFRSSNLDRLTVTNGRGQQILGTCDDCGDEVPLDGHLYKTVDGRYICETCKGEPRTETKCACGDFWCTDCNGHSTEHADIIEADRQQTANRYAGKRR